MIHRVVRNALAEVGLERVDAHLEQRASFAWYHFTAAGFVKSTSAMPGCHLSTW